jgi:hypothetical protein
MVLGDRTFVYSGWDRWDTKTGERPRNAVFSTTYNYAPYRHFPFSKFQVHCRDGIVRAIEFYDD